MMEDSRTSPQTLRELVIAVTGKEVYQPSSPHVDELIVLVMERRRLAVHRPELLPFLNALEQVLQMSRHFRQGVDLQAAHWAMFFDVLHGKAVTDTTLVRLDDFLVESLTKIYDASRPERFGTTPYDLMSPEERAEYSERVAASGRVLESLRQAREQEMAAQPYWLDEVPEFQLAA